MYLVQRLPPVAAVDSDRCLIGSKYEDDLLKLIDKDQLPVEYGGTASYDVRSHALQ